jgi:anti-anti-sigma factor
VTTCDLDVEHVDEEVRLRLAGEIDLTNSDLLDEQMRSEITNQTRSVLIDLTGIEYLDSTALRLFFGLAERLERMQVQLTVIAPATSIPRRVLDMAGFGHVAPIADG